MMATLDQMPSPNIRAVAPLAPEMTTPYDDTEGRPGRKAFNDLAVLTTRTHAWMAKWFVEESIAFYTMGAWLIGMPRLAKVEPCMSAVVVMNAGEGIGLTLALGLAEEGYTVFGLVHQDHKPEEDGSLGKLLFAWQQRRATVLREKERGNPSDLPELGNLLPLSFRPLSESSRKKVRQTILAYCAAQDLTLASVILTPVFSVESGRPLAQQRTPQLLIPISRNPYGEAVGAPEAPSPTDSDASSDDFIPTAGLVPKPPPTLGEAPRLDGSYEPLASTPPQVVQRAVQREFTEQLVVAQMFVEDLLPKPTPSPDGFTLSESRQPAALPRKTAMSTGERSRPSHLVKLLNRSTYEILDTDHSDSEAIEEHLLCKRLGVWYAFSTIKQRLLGLLPTVRQRPRSVPLERNGGKVIFFNGCGEVPGGGVGLSRPMSAAREAMGLALAQELGDLGVHISVINAGTLRSRAIAVANRDASSTGHQFRRARLAARISTLWALDKATCIWMAKTAVEARYPPQSYTLGYDMLNTQIASLIPTSIWQLLSWLAYEHLGGRNLESWAMNLDEGVTCWWLTLFPFSLIFKALSLWASYVQQPYP